jgi:hypothetical protein
MSNITIEPVRRRSRFTRAEVPPPFQITERDIALVREVAQHRFLRSTHISQLLEAPHKKILERLTPLYHAGYLDRPRAQIEYHVRGGGSEPLVYALGNRGAQLLEAQDSFDGADVDWAWKNQQSGREFILHTLAIADVCVALTIASRKHGAIELHQPHQLLNTLPQETRTASKPWAWRVRVQHNGATHEIGLLPDYVFALVYPDGRRRAFVVECDRGTMPVERSSLQQTSMLRKFLAYEASRKQKLHTERFGWKAFRSLIITANPDRAENMRALIARTPPLKGTPLVLVADHTTLLQSDILGSSWADARGKLHALV